MHPGNPQTGWLGCKMPLYPLHMCLFACERIIHMSLKSQILVSEMCSLDCTPKLVGKAVLCEDTRWGSDNPYLFHSCSVISLVAIHPVCHLVAVHFIRGFWKNFVKIVMPKKREHNWILFLVATTQYLIFYWQYMTKVFSPIPRGWESIDESWLTWGQWYHNGDEHQAWVVLLSQQGPSCVCSLVPLSHSLSLEVKWQWPAEYVYLQDWHFENFI